MTVKALLDHIIWDEIRFYDNNHDLIASFNFPDAGDYGSYYDAKVRGWICHSVNTNIVVGMVISE